MEPAYIGLGSNLGDREKNIRAALRLLCVLGPVRRSRMYDTEPVGLVGAPRFLNCVLEVWTSAEPLSLLSAALEVEAKLGRDRRRWRRARTIDVDVLMCGSRVVREPGLAVPHPRLHERAFVLLPLADLAPNLVHPILGETVREMLGRVCTAGVQLWPA